MDSIAVQAMRDALMNLADFNQHMIEAVAGYRALCVSHGFSEGAAEMMAVEWHTMLMRSGGS